MHSFFFVGAVKMDRASVGAHADPRKRTPVSACPTQTDKKRTKSPSVWVGPLELL